MTAGLTLRTLAKLTGAVLETGALETTHITRVASVATAREDALIFAEEATTLPAALASKAGAILVWIDADTEDARVLRVAQPRYAFAVVAKALAEQAAAPDGCRIHPSAVIDPTVRWGERVWIGPGAIIEAHAVLGSDVHIGSRAVIAEGVVLGDRVVVQSGAVLGSRGFGYVRERSSGEYLLFPQQGALVIEDDVEIGANTTIDRGALEETRIGRGSKIDNLVHIGHNCRIGRNVVIAAQAGISGSCVIEDGAVLAGQVGISDHCHIGPGVILGGQAGVYRGKTVTGPGEVFAGTPAEPLKEQMRGLAQVRAMARRRGPAKG